MIAGRVKSKEDVEAALKAAGFEPTDFRTATSRIWKSNRTGKHIQVPDPYDGMYPDAILRDRKEVADILGKATLH